jgi:serine/threonine protein kinase
MTDRPASEKSIFLVAIDKGSPEERAAYLDQACAGDPRLRAGVEALLAAHCRLDTASPPPEPADERAGTRVGPYKLLQQIGEGGMGAVFMAEQQQPVRRMVALKIIKPGMDTKQVIARFEAERQALALMDHPNIAKVLDGGATDSGRPYFVMELVKGVPLTHYCDEHRLTPRQRLELFVPVCQAIQHAHQKGIIHRDLKPSNVMVALYDGRPVPKVIDFGVAKAAGPRLTERSLFTEFGAVVGTLEYMSPEQAELNQLDIDTRSDVYSLGVLLYELLTGTTPLTKQRLKQTPFPELLRLIREEEPPRPSTRLSATAGLPAVAADRGLDPKKLCGLVRGELDWIAMKCLEKDRNRRYESAGALARDVERYLADQPVLACPPSAWYRFRKLARRNRGAVLTVTVIVLALVGAVIGTTWGLLRATEAEADAVAEAEAKEAARAEAVQNLGRALVAERAATRARDQAVDAEADTKAFGDFLVNHVLAVARPEGVQQGLGLAVTVVQALEAAEEKLDEVFARRPKAEATARHALGVTWRNLGRYDKAEAHLRRAVQLRERELGPNAPETLDSRNSLGVTLTQAGRADEAAALHEGTWKRAAAAFGPDHRLTLQSLNDLAWADLEAGRWDRALPRFEEVLAKRRARLGPEHGETLQSMSNLACAYRDAGRLDQAVPLHEQALAKRRIVFGPDHPYTLESMNNLAFAYGDAGQEAKALPLFRRTLALAEVKLGPDHPDTLTYLSNLACAYRGEGRPKEALPMLRQVLAKRQAVLGPDHRLTFVSEYELAVAHLNAGQWGKALPLLGQTLEKQRARLGPDHPDTLLTQAKLAWAYLDAKQADKALRLLGQTLDKQKATLGLDHPATLVTLAGLGVAYRDTVQLDKAVPLCEQALARRQATLGPDHPDTLTSMTSLAQTYRAAGQPEKAVSLYEEVLSKRKTLLGPGHPKTLLSMNNLAWAYAAAGRLADAAALFEQAATGLRARWGPDHPHTRSAERGVQWARRVNQHADGYAEALAAKGADDADTLAARRQLALALRLLHSPAAEGHFRAVYEARRRLLGREHLRTLDSHLELGQTLLLLKKYAEAEPALRDFLLIADEQLPDHWATFNAKSLLGLSLLRQKKYAEAEPLLVAGYEGMKQRDAQIPKESKGHLAEAVVRLVQLYDALGKPDQAEPWRAKLLPKESGSDKEQRESK